MGAGFHHPALLQPAARATAGFALYAVCKGPMELLPLLIRDQKRGSLFAVRALRRSTCSWQLSIHPERMLGRLSSVAVLALNPSEASERFSTHMRGRALQIGASNIWQPAVALW